MTFNREEFKKLAFPAIAALALLVAGAVLIWSAGESRLAAQRELSAAQAAEVISQVEPHVVIPMHYRPSTGTGEGPDPLDKFCREMGIEAVNVQPKLTILRSSLPVETQVVILSQR